MKRVFSYQAVIFDFMVFLFACLFVSCSHDDNDYPDVPSPPEQFHPIDASTRTLRDVIEAKEYAPAKFGEVIGDWPMLSYPGDGVAKLMETTLKAVVRNRLPQMDALFKERVGTAEDGSRQWQIKRRVFTYSSVSGETGNDTTLVGSVIFPTNTVGKPHQVDVLTLYHHQAYFIDSWLPSNAVTTMALHAMHNSAVIEPDGQGAKYNMKKLIRENIQGDLTALQMADCVLAALEVMRQENVTLAADGYTNNWGTSLGTVAATGFAQYMENDASLDLKMLFKMHATYIGEGPTMLSHIKGYENTVSNPKAQKFYSGWNPSLPFYMSSCPVDELVNYDEMKKYFTQLRTMPDGSVNSKVQWCDMIIPSIVQKAASTQTLGNHLLASVVSLFIASIVNDPADVEKYLMSNNDIFVEE